MNFLHYYHPNQILAQIGPLTVHWYGLIIAVALAVAVMVGLALSKSRGRSIDDFLDLALWVAIAGIVGGRLYDVFVIDWAYFYQYPNRIFNIWQGGLAIHGAIIGGAIALYAWCKLKKQDIWPWLDIVAIVLPLGQAIGRWGNYFNSELFGGPTNLPWGIPIAENLRPHIYQLSQYFHPAFLYESMLDLVLFAILFWQFKRNKLKLGQVSGLYLIGYGLIRFIMEFIRIDATAMLAGLRVPQIASVLLVIVGLAIIKFKSK